MKMFEKALFSPESPQEAQLWQKWHHAATRQIAHRLCQVSEDWAIFLNCFLKKKKKRGRGENTSIHFHKLLNMNLTSSHWRSAEIARANW